ncbi:MAG: hypothetical protein NVSMB47_08950 [Polyangiales bacterium]
MASRLTRLSLLEPATREVGTRRIRWGALALPLVIVGLVLGVREVARVERVLAAEGARASRVIVYELRPGSELDVPIEPGTDVFRLVIHAMRAGSLTPQPHVAHLTVTAVGAEGTRVDDLALELPGTATRVVAEESSLVVGDPAAVDVDTHGVGSGRLRIQLDGIEGADAALVRVYRRDALEGNALSKRTEKIDPAQRAHITRRLGELDWDDLDEPEQRAFLATRWRKVAALPDSKGLLTHAVALASAPQREERPTEDPATTVADLRSDERFALVVHGPTTLRARADGDPEAVLNATLRRADGSRETRDGRGTLTIEIPDGQALGIELTRATPGPLSRRTDDPGKLEASTHAVAWRTMPQRPMVVRAGAAPTVLRLTARRPVPRGSTTPVSIALSATIVGPGMTPETTLLRAERSRSIYDRYDARTPGEAPTSSAIFHLLLPAGATATLTPEEGPVDLSLSELDPAAPPRRVLSYDAHGTRPTIEEIGDVDWGGYVPRRPSNAVTFNAAARVLLRIPHRFVERESPATHAPTFRVKRPAASDTITLDGMTFDPASASFEIDAPGGEALVLPLRLFSKEPFDVVATIDGEPLARRRSGAAERITTARTIAVTGQVKSIVVLGDDLPAGKHVLTFHVPTGKQAWVHLPWVPKPRLPGTPPPDPHWIEGDLED